MIVVTCVMMIVSVLCLTLVAAAYQMYATANDEGRDELYYRNVISFSEVLREELTADYSETERPVTADGLAGYIFDFMDGSEETVTLVGNPDVNDLFEIDIKLDKTEARGCLVMTIYCVEGNEVMASCKCKYKESGGKYEFCEYY